MSNIRVTYTGFLSFFISIISAITGTIFTLILTRTLSQEEFGTWGLIGGTTQYVLIFSGIISYWSTRDVVRKIESGKTAIFGTFILSIFATIMYVVISYFIGSETKVDLNILYFSSILIPIIFFSGIITAINLGFKPHTISYGLLAQSISQILFAIIFVYYLQLGVLGIILTQIISQMLYVVILFKYSYQQIKNKFNLTYIKKWLKLFWIPLYPWLPNAVDATSISIFSIMTGSVIGLSFWTAAAVLSAIITQTGQISKAVYPKLLESNDTHYLRDNMSQLFFFNFMITAMVIIFAKPALYALNPVYVSAFFVVIILAINNFFATLTTTSIQNLTGIEKIDLDEKASVKRYLRSKLFYPHTLRLLHTLASTIILIVGFRFLLNSNFTEIELLIFWALTILITHVPISIYLLSKMIRTLHIKLDHKLIIQYFIITLLAFIPIFFLTENYLVYENNLQSFIPHILLFFGIGIFFYVFLAYSTDKKTRQLVTSIINEIKSRSL